MQQQTTQQLLMVRPANFGRASETVADNGFQEAVAFETFDSIGQRAVAEFDSFVALLRRVGVEVTVVDDSDSPVKPDAVFCNNWFSTHPGGKLVTYPCYWPQRRLERQDAVLRTLHDSWRVEEHLDLTALEEEDEFLESTGCLLLDRRRRIAYACLSNRCSQAAIEDWCRSMDYRAVCFSGHDARGQVIYHTNVMMAIGTSHAILCAEAIKDAEERKRVVDSLKAGGKKIVEISLEQIDHFAGNALEVVTTDGPAWIMSTAAFASLTEPQRLELVSPQNMRIVHSELPTIERYGGGSARCMLAEIFLNKL